MYIDISTNKNYPKTLVIRNEDNGLIWQVYNIKAEEEAFKLSKNAAVNGFNSITLENYNKDLKETFPNWRESFKI